MSGLQIIQCEQGSEEWFAARLGIPTASEFSTVMASGRGGGESKTRRTYMMKLAGEILTGQPMDSFSNAHMERGKEMEAEARSYYSIVHGIEVQQVGFIRNGDKGYSPDGLIGTEGAAEIKTKLPHLLIDTLVRDQVPPEHMAQLQGGLWVSEREWIDFVAYWPGLPMFRKRVTRDEKYIAVLAQAVADFNEELAALVEQIRAMDAPREAA